VSHEFRTPLNHILGGVELLLAESEPGQAVWLSRIRDAARSLNAMVDGTLDLVQLSSGKVMLDLAPFSIASLTREIVAMAAPRASAKGLALSSSVDPGIPEVLVGDARRISQLAGVYVENALKFTARGGVDIAFSLEREVPGGIVLRCSVSDTGEGIDRALQGEVFSPFMQGDASITRRHGGLGLGLASVRGIVALMDGEAGVRSDIGKGSCFWFTASLARSANAPGSHTDAAMPPVAEPPVESTPASRAQAVAALRDLETLLAADDLRAVAAFRDMTGRVRTVVGSAALTEMEAAMSLFDFAAAAEQCRRLADTISAG
jgi:signal transduction histidine kinase